MSNSALETAAFGADQLSGAAQWASRMPVRLPPALVRRMAADREAWRDPTFRNLASNAARELRLSAAFTPAPPASARLPAHYHMVPGPMRRLIGRVIGRVHRVRQARWSRFPGWPLDLSADFAADLARERGIVFERIPVLLSHDIDTPEGLRNAVKMFLPVEEAAGARSTHFIVPCAWPVDHALVSEIQSRGHEIGVHGFNHANRTPFADTPERRQRLAAGRDFGNRYGATGYRAPSLLRTRELLADLAPLYHYNSSIPTAGGAFPVPNNGCASARPWRLGEIWEIPLTLPRDGSLRFLGHSPAEIGQLWCECAETIASSGGIVSLLTHCEAGFSGNARMLPIYRAFLEWIATDHRFEFMRMDQLAGRIETARASGQ